MKYRSKTDIIAMILQGATPGATKTRLMYGALLSHSQVQEYLSFLIERGLLAHEKKTAEYKITEQGLKFLRVYEEISRIVSQEQVETVESPLAPSK